MKKYKLSKKHKILVAITAATAIFTTILAILTSSVLTSSNLNIAQNNYNLLKNKGGSVNKIPSYSSLKLPSKNSKYIDDIKTAIVNAGQNSSNISNINPIKIISTADSTETISSFDDTYQYCLFSFTLTQNNSSKTNYGIYYNDVTSDSSNSGLLTIDNKNGSQKYIAESISQIGLDERNHLYILVTANGDSGKVYFQKYPIKSSSSSFKPTNPLDTATVGDDNGNIIKMNLGRGSKNDWTNRFVTNATTTRWSTKRKYLAQHINPISGDSDKYEDWSNQFHVVTNTSNQNLGYGISADIYYSNKPMSFMVLNQTGDLSSDIYAYNYQNTEGHNRQPYQNWYKKLKLKAVAYNSVNPMSSSLNISNITSLSSVLATTKDDKKQNILVLTSYNKESGYGDVYISEQSDFNDSDSTLTFRSLNGDGHKWNASIEPNQIIQINNSIFAIGAHTIQLVSLTQTPYLSSASALDKNTNITGVSGYNNHYYVSAIEKKGNSDNKTGIYTLLNADSGNTEWTKVNFSNSKPNNFNINNVVAYDSKQHDNTRIWITVGHSIYVSSNGSDFERLPGQYNSTPVMSIDSKSSNYKYYIIVKSDTDNTPNTLYESESFVDTLNLTTGPSDHLTPLSQSDINVDNQNNIATLKYTSQGLNNKINIDLHNSNLYNLKNSTLNNSAISSSSYTILDPERKSSISKFNFQNGINTLHLKFIDSDITENITFRLWEKAEPKSYSDNISFSSNNYLFFGTENSLWLSMSSSNLASDSYHKLIVATEKNDARNFNSNNTDIKINVNDNALLANSTVVSGTIKNQTFTPAGTAQSLNNVTFINGKIYQIKLVDEFARNETFYFEVGSAAQTTKYYFKTSNDTYISPNFNDINQANEFYKVKINTAHDLYPVMTFNQYKTLSNLSQYIGPDLYNSMNPEHWKGFFEPNENIFMHYYTTNQLFANVTLKFSNNTTDYLINQIVAANQDALLKAQASYTNFAISEGINSYSKTANLYKISIQNNSVTDYTSLHKYQTFVTNYQDIAVNTLIQKLNTVIYNYKSITLDWSIPNLKTIVQNYFSKNASLYLPPLTWNTNTMSSTKDITDYINKNFNDKVFSQAWSTFVINQFKSEPYNPKHFIPRKYLNQQIKIDETTANLHGNTLSDILNKAGINNNNKPKNKDQLDNYRNSDRSYKQYLEAVSDGIISPKKSNSKLLVEIIVPVVCGILIIFTLISLTIYLFARRAKNNNLQKKLSQNKNQHVQTFSPKSESKTPLTNLNFKNMHQRNLASQKLADWNLGSQKIINKTFTSKKTAQLKKQIDNNINTKKVDKQSSKKTENKSQKSAKKADILKEEPKSAPKNNYSNMPHGRTKSEVHPRKAAASYAKLRPLNLSRSKRTFPQPKRKGKPNKNKR